MQRDAVEKFMVLINAPRDRFPFSLRTRIPTGRDESTARFRGVILPSDR